ncbi:MAG: divalent metal cation transporter [Candidatus Omnitrophica bacterium]|nr:divalent metal cation transporter [Candidatus Omnitrophota bacterium]
MKSLKLLRKLKSGLKLKDRHALRLRELFRVWGPAWLVMIADVDAASTITAAESGVQYGTKLVWFLMVLIIPLYIIQEVAGRVGTVTCKGLGELIKENYSRRMAIFAAVPMALVDTISYIVEYTGCAIGFQLFGIPPLISVPVVFLIHISVVYKKKYIEAEKPLIAITVLFALAWIISAFLRARHGISFTPFYFSASPDFIYMLAANVGAVIMPFMLFYQASATAEKCITINNLWAVRLETFIGAFASEVIMVAILIATVGVSASSLQFASPKVLSHGLASVAGGFAPYFFGIGLLTASFIALIVISLGSSWGVVEALGWGRKNWFKIYLFESIPAVIIPMLSLNLINLAINLMILQLVVLVVPAVILGMMASDKKLMGDYFLHGLNKWIYWIILVLIFFTGLITMILLIKHSL